MAQTVNDSNHQFPERKITVVGPDGHVRSLASRPVNQVLSHRVFHASVFELTLPRAGSAAQRRTITPIFERDVAGSGDVGGGP